jgi:hypothetical protein
MGQSTLYGTPSRVGFCGELGTGLVCGTINSFIGLSDLDVAAEGMTFGLN